MLSPWFAPLKSFIRRLLGFPMSTDFAELFNARLTRECSWSIEAALNSYLLAGGSTTSTPPRVRRVQLKKCLPSRAEHEYILVDIVSASGVGISQLIFERSYDPAHGNPVVNIAADLTRKSSTSSTSGSSPVPSKLNKPPIPAKDTVTFDPNPDKTRADTTVFSYTFHDDSAPSLLDVLVAADTLNIHSPYYILLERQCYWYAGMLFRILMGDITGDIEVDDDGKDTWISPAFVPPKKDTGEPEDPEETKPVRAGQAGSFKELFSIVTKKSIDELYNTDIKKAYQARHQEVAELAKRPQEAVREAEEAAREAKAEAARQAEAAREAKAESARQVKEAARQAEAAREAKAESARLREELARLRAAAPERLGAIPPAQ